MRNKYVISIIFLIALTSCGQTQEHKKNLETSPYTYTNQLIHESSPYLLQHVHNPVNWYPMGEEAMRQIIK